MITWSLWAVLLVLQNAAHTWTSRARNSRSLPYHATAAVFSNGVWIVSLSVALDKLAEARASGSWLLFAGTCAFYILFTVAGSVGAHHVLMNHVERGKAAL